MEDDPIREEQTIFSKFKELGKKLFAKPPKKENYFISPYTIDGMATLAEQCTKVGITADEAQKMILKFNKII